MKTPKAFAPLLKHWERYAGLYALRNRRERIIIGLALVALVYALLDAVLLTPALRDLKNSREGLHKAQSELTTLQQQAQALSLATTARDAELSRALKDAGGESARVLEALQAFDRVLVPPAQMAQFLRQLIGANKLELVQFKTLPVAHLVDRAASPVSSMAGDKVEPRAEQKAEDKGKDKDNAVPKAASPDDPVRGAPNLYKHGVEFTVAGPYPVLLQYLAQLEASPQKVLWGRMELKADKYPRSELTLVLYTLSLEATWLQL